MAHQSLIDDFSRSAFRGSAAWFLGAGVSLDSGLPDWHSFLKPFAERIGINISEAGEDLPAIAQYIINHHSGNRGPFLHTILNSIGSITKPTAYHNAIAKSSIGLIWTTNYDLLMEAALAGVAHVVRSRDDQFVGWDTSKGDIEIIKAHGSVKGTNINDIVITTEDYEDYAIKRPATIHRLRSDLLCKSFLFVGYSYGDPNIKTALVEARRLAGKATLPHFMLQKKIDPETDPEKARRQELWCTDLRRVGVDCFLTQDHSETLRIVEQIAIRSRGPTIYITGSHENHGLLAEEIGRDLALYANTPILLDGQSSGTSRSALLAFQATCIEQKKDIRQKIRFFPNPYAADPSFSNDKRLLPLLKQWRRPLLRQAHTVLVFDGGIGTMAEVEIAESLGCRIVPIPQKDGSVAELLDKAEIAADLNNHAPGYLSKAKDYALTADDVVACALSGLPSW